MDVTKVACILLQAKMKIALGSSFWRLERSLESGLLGTDEAEIRKKAAGAASSQSAA